MTGGVRTLTAYFDGSFRDTTPVGTYAAGAWLALDGHQIEYAAAGGEAATSDEAEARALLLAADLTGAFRLDPGAFHLSVRGDAESIIRLAGLVKSGVERAGRESVRARNDLIREAVRAIAGRGFAGWDIAKVSRRANGKAHKIAGIRIGFELVKGRLIGSPQTAFEAVAPRALPEFSPWVYR